MHMQCAHACRCLQSLWCCLPWLLNNQAGCTHQLKERSIQNTTTGAKPPQSQDMPDIVPAPTAVPVTIPASLCCRWPLCCKAAPSTAANTKYLNCVLMHCRLPPLLQYAAGREHTCTRARHFDIRNYTAADMAASCRGFCSLCVHPWDDEGCEGTHHSMHTACQQGPALTLQRNNEGPHEEQTLTNTTARPILAPKHPGTAPSSSFSCSAALHSLQRQQLQQLTSTGCSPAPPSTTTHSCKTPQTPRY